MLARSLGSSTLALALIACQARVDVSGPGAPTTSMSHADRTGPTRTVLVELFTSQGCSSCPPADELLGRLPDLGFAPGEIVALSYHVTYWDDLGWADPFGSARHDQRQLGYAHAVPGHEPGRAAQGPYTPQMIVDGRVHFPGGLADVAQQQIARARSEAPMLTLTPRATLRDGVVEVHVHSEPAMRSTARLGLYVVLAQRSVETEVPRGENAGKKLREHGVVRAMAGPLALPAAGGDVQQELPVPAGLGPEALELVVFAQDTVSLAIAATARVDIGG